MGSSTHFIDDLTHYYIGFGLAIGLPVVYDLAKITLRLL